MKYLAAAALTFLIAFYPARTYGQDDVMVEKRITNLDVTGSRDVYFDLDTGAELDSGSVDWDLWFNGSRVQVNGELAIIDKKFDAVFKAPANGYLDDNMGLTSFPSGSDDGWFIYDPTTHTVEAVPQRTFIVKNRDGNYAKVEFISYYKDSTPADTPGAEPRFYTFRYKLNISGESKF